MQNIILIIIANKNKQDFDFLDKTTFKVAIIQESEANLETIHQYQPTLMLLDGESKFEQCYTLQSDPIICLIPKLILIDLNRLEERARVFASGAVDYLLKPIQPEEVIARLTTHSTLQKAQSLEQAKLTFVASMGHKLRTPLHAILGYAQILKRHLGSTAQYREEINAILRSSDKLLTMVKNLVDLAKIETEQVALYPNHFPLDELLKRTTELFKTHAKQKEITLTYQRLSHLPTAVHADEKRLKQVLMYLLENAIQFTNRGEIKLTAGYQKGKIRFQVVDTGIGIAANELTRIFLPFHQIHQMDHRSEGAGLGLSIATKLVTLMNGQLQVESQPEQGSLFWFALDLPDISESSDEVLLPATLQTHDLRILIVDEIEERRAKICQRLKNLALFTLEAVSYSDALAKIKDRQPSIVFMVIHLIDEAISQQCLLQETRLIAMVDDVFESDKLNIEDLPKLLVDPFYNEDLIEQLQNYFEQPIPMEIIKTAGQQKRENFPMGPSQEQAALLLEKATRGDIYGVSCYVEQLEQAEKRLVPFAKYIKELAFHLEEEKICEIAKCYMDNPT